MFYLPPHLIFIVSSILLIGNHARIQIKKKKKCYTFISFLSIRGIFIFPVQLITSRIGNLTRLIHTLLYVMTIHTYIPKE